MPDTDIIQPRLPLIGDKAPEFSANTTNGPVHFPDNYVGKWVILFSHPNDFTPVCTTEFIAFQNIIDELHDLNTEILGLSVGANPSHLAWFDAIEQISMNGHKVKITFPLIDDLDMSVARLYGMIHPNISTTHAVRAVFIIDPNGIIRTILYYPASTGRNFDEIKRILIALQATDAFGVSTPANWEPGKPVLIGAPTTTEQLHERLNSKKPDLDVKAWFLTFKKLGADTILSKLHKKTIKK